MKFMPKGTSRASLVAGLLLAGAQTQAQLPPDFPQLSILPNTNPAPGYFFGSLAANGVPGVSSYFAILDNENNAVLLDATDSLGTLACNGLFVTMSAVAGQPLRYLLKDSEFHVAATLQAGNGYQGSDRDFEVLPNGHALILIADPTPVIDMSRLVPGGSPAAQVTQAVVQEVDAVGNVVFQWRSLDYIPVTDSYQILTNAIIGDYIGVNSVWSDDTDGNLILSCRNTAEVIKISRATGGLLWRMQGRHNQFTFSNSIKGNSDPAPFLVQSNARRLPNGHLTLFDNGYSQDLDPAYSFARPYSRAAEYALDEVHKTATLVWEYRHHPDIISYNGGSVQRLTGGHTVIQWGSTNSAAPALAMTEVDAAGLLVCDVALLQPGVTGAFTRLVWPPQSTYTEVTEYGLAELNTYPFAEFGIDTGVTLDVGTIDADIYNNATVSVQPFAPIVPLFSDTAPRVLSLRIIISPYLIDDITGTLSFDVNSLGLTDPTNTTVYWRPTPGQGLFGPLPTVYDWVTHELQAGISGVGEFIFGLPNLAPAPPPPVITGGSLSRLSQRTIQLAVNAPNTTTATVLESADLATWQVLQVLTVVNGAAVFVDTPPTNCPPRFYRVRVP